MIGEIKIRSRAAALTDFYYKRGRMPSFSELCHLWNLSSKNAVSRTVDKLMEIGVIKKDEKGRLIPRSIIHTTRLLGSIEAGFPSPAEEELADTISLDEMLIQDKKATFLLKVSGDSMSEAGILPGDMVLVDKGLTPVSGDIVIAQVDGEWTMKYLRKRGNKVTLAPANPKFRPIKPKHNLSIGGVVTAVIRKYK